MAKKKAETEVGEVISEDVEMIAETAKVEPIKLTESIEAIPTGYIQIRPIGKESNGVVVKAKTFGTVYPKDKWELVSTKKK